MGWKEFRKGSHARGEYWKGQHRFEHWYVDNQVYFITARVRGRYPAFASSEAQSIFWHRFSYYTGQLSYTPWVTSLLDNHYHTLGYLKHGSDLPKLMRLLHGSVAKLVNDILPERVTPFWVDAGHQNYFDGCIRDELQARRAYRYTLLQCRRHRICKDWRAYANTRRHLALDRAIKRSHELEAFLEALPYKRYQRKIARKPNARWDDD
jgi:hypothetical protein